MQGLQEYRPGMQEMLILYFADKTIDKCQRWVIIVKESQTDFATINNPEGGQRYEHREIHPEIH